MTWDVESTHQPTEETQVRKISLPRVTKFLSLRHLIFTMLFLFCAQAVSADVTSSGAYQTSIPFEVPPYHGLQPTLGLTYDSNGRNGFVGVGWTLSGLSSIERASRGKGVPRYDTVDVSQSSQDIALLDGTELIKCTSFISSPSCKNPSSASTGYVYYATKIESFQRIAYDPATPFGVWHVWQKDGTMLTYGGPATTWLSSGGTYRWLLSSVTDTQGNTVGYEYACTTDSGIFPNVGECYPSRIGYNFNPAIGSQVKVVFYREPRPDVITYAMGGDSIATMRYRLRTIDVLISDSSGDHRARAYVLRYRSSTSSSRSLLFSVQQFGNDAQLDATGNVTNAAAAVTLPLQTFSPTIGGSPGSYASAIGPPFAGSTQPQQDPPIAISPFWDTLWMPIADAGGVEQRCFTGDVDGDGTSETICAMMHPANRRFPYDHTDFQVAFYPKNGRPFTPITRETAHRWYVDVDGTAVSSSFYPGDFDGDGRTDIAAVLPIPDCDQASQSLCGCVAGSGTPCPHVAISVWLSNGDGTFRLGFGFDTPWKFSTYDGNYSIVGFFSDINGDGKTDVMLSFPDSPPSCGSTDVGRILRSATSTGFGFTNLRETCLPWFAGTDLTAIEYTGDIDGDHKTDLIRIHRRLADDSVPHAYAEIQIARSTGTGFVALPAIEVTDLVWPATPTFGDYCKIQWRMGDIDGDGKTDLLVGLEVPATDTTPAGTSLRAFLSQGDGQFKALPVGTYNGVPWTACALNVLQVETTIGIGLGSAFVEVGLVNLLDQSPRQVFPEVQYGDDVNGDGKSDFVLSQQTNAGVVVSTLLSNGDGSFTVGPQVTAPWTQGIILQQLTGGDVNGDGITDLFFSYPSTAGTLLGVITFPNRGLDTFHWRPAEVNGDGRLDHVYIQQVTQGIEVYTAISRQGGWDGFSQASGNMPVLTGAPADTQARMASLNTPDTQNWKPMDVNGDGLTDLVYVEHFPDGSLNPPYGTRVYTLLSSGTGSYQATYQTVLTGNLADLQAVDTQNWIPADVDGDGKVDLVHIRTLPPVNPGLYVEVLRSNGNGTWTHWSQAILERDTGMSLAQPDCFHWKVADVNGDGRADLIYVKGNDTGGITVYVLLSSSVPAGSVVWSPTMSTGNMFGGEVFPDAFNWKTMDVNGDGKTDLTYVRVTPYTGICTVGRGCDTNLHIRVLFSSGSGNAWKPVATDMAAGPVPLDGFNWRAMDSNGDGRMDLVYVNSSGIYTVFSRDENGWSPLSFNAQSFRGSAADVRGWYPAGVDDAGRSTFLIPGYDFAGSFGFQSLSSTGALDTTVVFANGMGGTTTITYAPSFLHLLSLPVFPCGLPAGMNLQVVASVMIEDGRGNSSIQSYQYQCPRWSYRERLFLGLGHVKESTSGTASTAASIIETYSSQGDNCLVKPETTMVKDSQGRFFGQEVIFYIPEGHAPPYKCLPKDQLVSECNLTTACRQVGASFAYDAFGNRALTSEYGDGLLPNQDRVTIRAFNANSDLYIVGLPNTEEVYEGRGGSGPLRSQVNYCYDVYNSPPGCSKFLTQGLLTSVWLWNDHKGKYHTITFSNDGFGNRTVVMDSKGHATVIGYDYGAFDLYPTTICNTLNQCVSQEWDYRVGQVIKSVDRNQTTTRFFYDPVGRPLRIEYPDGGRTTFEYHDWGNPNLQRTRMVVEDGTQDGLWIDSYFDGLGRTYRVVKKGDAPGVTFNQDTIYADASMRVHKESHPYAGGTAPVYEVFQYDGAKRLISKTHPDGSMLSWSYKNDRTSSWVTFLDEVGHERVTYTDAFDRTSKVGEKVQGQYIYTSYSYDVLNHLTQITDASGNVTTITWDSLGRQLSTSDPDMGGWAYDYDDVGNLINQTDARGITTVWTYDPLNRKQTEWQGPQQGNLIIWYYDEPGHGAGIGRLTSILDPTGTGSRCTNPLGANQLADSFTYDAMGRITSHFQCVFGSSYALSFSYYKTGQLATITYPPDNPSLPAANEVVTYTYDLAGRMYSVSGYVTSMGYDPAGKLKTVVFPNGTSEQFWYEPNRDWLQVAEVSQTTLPIFTMVYFYWPDGLVQSALSGTSNRANHYLNYTYDDLHRLLHVKDSINLDVPAQSFTYDAMGNMTFNSAIGIYTYPASGPNGCGTGVPCAHPHAVTQAGNRAYSYDANGNMITRNGKTVTWDYRNLVQWLQDENDAYTTSFSYDASGERVYKVTPDGGYHYYFGSLLEQEGTPGISPVSLWKYYYAGQLLVARKDSQGNKMWYHGDRLGSTRLLTDSNGTVLQQYDYKPFGETANLPANPATDIRYTGQRADDTTGLIYLHARYYDPALARFVSADVVVPQPFNPQNLNRYSYGMNNPISNVDPTGHQDEDWVPAPTGPPPYETIVHCGCKKEPPPPPPVTPPPLVRVEGGDPVRLSKTELSRVVAGNHDSSTNTPVQSPPSQEIRKPAWRDEQGEYIEVGKKEGAFGISMPGYRLQHLWIKTPNVEAGMGPENAEWGTDAKWLPTLNVKITHHEGFAERDSPGNLHYFTRVHGPKGFTDRVEQQLTFGKPLGRLGLNNNCQTFCTSVLYRAGANVGEVPEVFTPSRALDTAVGHMMQDFGTLHFFFSGGTGWPDLWPPMSPGLVQYYQAPY